MNTRCHTVNAGYYKFTSYGVKWICIQCLVSIRYIYVSYTNYTFTMHSECEPSSGEAKCHKWNDALIKTHSPQPLTPPEYLDKNEHFWDISKTWWWWKLTKFVRVTVTKFYKQDNGIIGKTPEMCKVIWIVNTKCKSYQITAITRPMLFLGKNSILWRRLYWVARAVILSSKNRLCLRFTHI